MRISDWSSDVCSSDLDDVAGLAVAVGGIAAHQPYRFLAEKEGRAHVDREEAVPQLRRGFIDAAAVGDAGGVHQAVEAAEALLAEIGRASCRDRVCQYVSLSVVAGFIKKQTEMEIKNSHV